MGVKVFWDNFEHDAIRFELIGRWSWREFGKQMRVAVDMIRSVPHRVDIIVNATQSNGAPTELTQYANSLIPYVPDNCGTLMLVGKTRKICDVFAKIHKPYIRSGFDILLVGNMEQARKGLYLRRRYAMAS